MGTERFDKCLRNRRSKQRDELLHCPHIHEHWRWRRGHWVGSNRGSGRIGREEEDASQLLDDRAKLLSAALRLVGHALRHSHVPPLEGIHVTVRSTLPRQPAIRGHVDERVQHRLEVVQQGVRVVGEVQTVAREEGRTSDAVSKGRLLFGKRHVPTGTM